MNQHYRLERREAAAAGGETEEEGGGGFFPIARPAHPTLAAAFADPPHMEEEAGDGVLYVCLCPYSIICRSDVK